MEPTARRLERAWRLYGRVRCRAPSEAARGRHGEGVAHWKMGKNKTSAPDEKVGQANQPGHNSRRSVHCAGRATRLIAVAPAPPGFANLLSAQPNGNATGRLQAAALKLPTSRQPDVLYLIRTPRRRIRLSTSGSGCTRTHAHEDIGDRHAQGRRVPIELFDRSTGGVGASPRERPRRPLHSRTSLPSPWRWDAYVQAG